MSQSDAEIMRDVQSGREDRFEEIAVRYRERLTRAAQSRFADPAAADDVVQETLLNAFASRGTFDVRMTFSTWIWTIFLNACRRAGKKQAREHDLLCRAAAADGGYAAEGYAAAGGLAPLLESERRDQLQAMLDQLAAADADALRLRFFGGLKFDDIAVAMDCSLGAAKLRVKRGLMKLAELWRDAHEEADRIHTPGELRIEP